MLKSADGPMRQRRMRTTGDATGPVCHALPAHTTRVQDHGAGAAEGSPTTATESPWAFHHDRDDLLVHGSIRGRRLHLRRQIRRPPDYQHVRSRHHREGAGRDWTRSRNPEAGPHVQPATPVRLGCLAASGRSPSADGDGAMPRYPTTCQGARGRQFYRRPTGSASGTRRFPASTQGELCPWPPTHASEHLLAQRAVVLSAVQEPSVYGDSSPGAIESHLRFALRSAS